MRPTLERLALAKGLPIDFLQDLGWTDSPNGIVVPYRNRDGSLFRNRLRISLDDKQKYLWDEGRGSTVYGAEHLTRTVDFRSLLVVEGETDCAALWLHGFNALGLPGNTTQKCLELKHVKRFDSVVIWREKGDSGLTFQKLTLARLKELGYVGTVYRIDAELLEVKDPCELHQTDPVGFPEMMKRLVREARCLEMLMPKADGNRLAPLGEIGEAPKPAAATRTRKLAEVEGRCIEWLIPGWLPRGTLTLVSGDGRAGKSTLIYSLIADLTRGRSALGYEGFGLPPIRVLLVSVEDDPASKIAPIIAAAGGDLERVEMIEAMKDSRGQLLPIDLSRTEQFAEVLTRTGAELLVLDPVASLLPGGTDDNSDASVRSAIDPIAALAAKLRLAVIVVKHVGKATGNSQLGSVAWRNRARASWLVIRGEGEDRYLFDNGSSVAADQPGRKFSISILEGERRSALRRIDWFTKLSAGTFDGMTTPKVDASTGRIVCGGVPSLSWLGEADQTLEEVMELKGKPPADEPAEPPRKLGSAECAEWLVAYLGVNRSWPDREVRKAAADAGFTDRTYMSAKNRLREVTLAGGERFGSKPSGGAGSAWLIGFCVDGDVRRLPAGNAGGGGARVAQTPSLADSLPEREWGVGGETGCETGNGVSGADSHPSRTPPRPLEREGDCETGRLDAGEWTPTDRHVAETDFFREPEENGPQGGMHPWGK